MNKFEQVSSDGHPGITSKRGAQGLGVPCLMSGSWDWGQFDVSCPAKPGLRGHPVH